MDGHDIARSIGITMSMMFLVWVGAVAYASSRLIWANWREIIDWPRQPREQRVTLALWISVPGMKFWLLWMRSVDTWSLITTDRPPNPHSLAGLPFALVILSLMVWWVCDRSFGQERGDRVTKWLLFGGAGIGLVCGALFGAR